MKGTKSVTMYITAFFFCCFFILGIRYVADMKRQSELRMSHYLQDTTHQRSLALQRQIHNDLDTLKMAGKIIAETRGQDISSLHSALQAANHDASFLRLGLADIWGNTEIVSQEEEPYQAFLADLPAFVEAQTGVPVVSEVYWDERSGQYAIGYVVPITEAGQINSFLCALRPDHLLQALMTPPITPQSGAFLLVDREGVILAQGHPLTPAFQRGASLFSLAEFPPHQREALASALERQQPGRITLLLDGAKFFVTAEALGINDWALVSVIGHRVIDGYYNRMLTGLTLILLVSAATAAFLLYWHARHRRISQRQLEALAYTDPLTQGRNAAKFQKDAERILAHNPKDTFAVWTFDTKNFTRINNLFSGEIGNRVLQRIFFLLSAADSPQAASCRIGSDVFAGIRPYTSKKEIEAWFWSVLRRMEEREVILESQLQIDNVMGVYCTGDFDSIPSLQEMLSHASAARRCAKIQPGNTLLYYTQEMQREQALCAALEAGAQGALVHQEMTFFLQPKVCIQNGYQVVGAEALARWNHPDFGWISPATFIPIFEDSGFIIQLDRYIFLQVCKWYGAYQQRGGRPLRIAVNICRKGVVRDDVVSYYTGIKEKYGIADGVLELEFTESIAQGDHQLFLSIVTQLQQNGFTCAIDDFGAGYSSLNLVRSLPMDVLKLDAEFFRGEWAPTRGQIVVESFLHMAKALGITTVAEGIERPEQVPLLAEMGCDIVQGYVFSKPLSTDDFERWVRDAAAGLSL